LVYKKYINFVSNKLHLRGVLKIRFFKADKILKPE